MWSFMDCSSVSSIQVMLVDSKQSQNSSFIQGLQTSRWLAFVRIFLSDFFVGFVECNRMPAIQTE